MNKRGGILDVFWVFLIVFVIALIWMISFKIMDDIKPNLDSQLTSDVALNATASAHTAIANLDYILIIVFVGLIISVIVGAYFIQSHPVFFVVSLILLILLMVFIPMFSNVFEKVTEAPSLEAAVAEYDVTTSLFDNYPIYFVVICGLVMIVLYSKYRTGGGAV